MKRPLSAVQVRRLEALRRAARLLDSAFALPGTSVRIGLDPIMGLIPVLGDLLSPVFTAAVLWQALDLGVPRVVQLRMVLNVAIDVVLGLIPIAGDLADVAWKANSRNLALLETHARVVRPAAVADWVFVAVVLTLLAATVAAPVLLVVWLARSVGWV